MLTPAAFRKQGDQHRYHQWISSYFIYQRAQHLSRSVLLTTCDFTGKCCNPVESVNCVANRVKETFFSSCFRLKRGRCANIWVNSKKKPPENSFGRIFVATLSWMFSLNKPLAYQSGQNYVYFSKIRLFKELCTPGEILHVHTFIKMRRQV